MHQIIWIYSFFQDCIHQFAFCKQPFRFYFTEFPLRNRYILTNPALNHKQDSRHLKVLRHPRNSQLTIKARGYPRNSEGTSSQFFCHQILQILLNNMYERFKKLPSPEQSKNYLEVSALFGGLKITSKCIGMLLRKTDFCICDADNAGSEVFRPPRSSNADSERTISLLGEWCPEPRLSLPPDPT